LSPPTQQGPPHRHRNKTSPIALKSVAFSHDYHPRIFQRGEFSSRLTNVRFMNPNRARFWADLCASLSDLSNYKIYQPKLNKTLRFPPLRHIYFSLRENKKSTPQTLLGGSAPCLNRLFFWWHSLKNPPFQRPLKKSPINEKIRTHTTNRKRLKTVRGRPL
jgi:hypothetical protein